MNWPPLTSKTSEILADVLRDCVHQRPKDLFGFVAQALQEKSGLDPEEFERNFEECQRKPRTYILEERCPAGQNPLAWVPMRYNDETILLSLQQRAAALTSEILSALTVGDMKDYLDRLCVSFPELMYIRQTPSEPISNFRTCPAEELAVFQALRAVYIGCSGCEQMPFDDESVELSFNCEVLCAEARETLMRSAKSEPILEALIAFIVLRALGSNEGFRGRFGGPAASDRSVSPEEAVLYAIEHEASALPSYSRLSEHQRLLVKAALQTFFPADMLISTEAVPVHFLQVKELLAPHEGGLEFLKCALTVDHMVRCRSALVRDEVVDHIKLGMHCLCSLDKYSAPRAYELLLKKRAEKHSWRIVRDDWVLKAIVRLCCLSGAQDTDSWNAMLQAVESIQEHEQEVLKTELVRKDGCTDSPVHILLGASKLMEAAMANPAVGARCGTLFLVRVLEDATRHFSGALSGTQRSVTLSLPTCAKRAREFAQGGAPFEGTQFSLRETGPCHADIVLAGDDDAN